MLVPYTMEMGRFPDGVWGDGGVATSHGFPTHLEIGMYVFFRAMLIPDLQNGDRLDMSRICIFIYFTYFVHILGHLVKGINQ